MYSALTNASLVSGIKQASPESQTSCLEEFHSIHPQPILSQNDMLLIYRNVLQVSAFGVKFLPSASVTLRLSRFQTNLSEKEQIRDFYVQLAVS